MKILLLLLISWMAMSSPAFAISLDERIFKNELYLAKKDVKQSMFSVALRYRYGQGVEKNEAEADAWMIKAVAAGSEIAEFYVAVERGRAGKDSSADKALYKEIMRKANDIVLRDGSLKYAQGLMYLYGVGITKDLDKAMSSFHTAKLMDADYLDDNAVADIKREYDREQLLKQRKEGALIALRAKEMAALATRQKARAKKAKAKAEAAARHRNLTAQQEARAKAKAKKAEEKRKYDEYTAFQAELAKQEASFEAEERKRITLEDQAKQEDVKEARLKTQKKEISRLMEVDPCTTSAAVFMSTC